MSSFVAEIPVPLSTLASWSRGALYEFLQQDGLSLEDARIIWRALLASLDIPTLSEKQTTSTCNCVRIFLQSISTAKNLDTRTLPLARDAWSDCYHVIRNAWPRAKVKPLAQVLEVLLQTARKGMSEDELNSVWRIISLELSAVVLRGQQSRHLKGALALSAFFLEKNLSIDIYLSSAEQNMKQGIGEEKNTSDVFNCLIQGVLLAFEQHDAQSSAEKCFKALLNSQHSLDLDSWWFVVRGFLADHIDSLDMIAMSIFPILLERESSLQLDVIQSMCHCNDRAGLLFTFALLQSLRDREMVNQSDLTGLLQRIIKGPTLGAPDAIELLLSHADDGVRVRILRLLTTSKMTNAPLSLIIIRHVHRNIALWFRSGGSHERGELLSIIKRLLVRLRGGASALKKTASSSTLDLELLNAHKDFLAVLITSVVAELRPSASYQRHVMGLSILRHLLQSKIDSCDRSFAQTSSNPEWPFSICLRRADIAQHLLYLVSDAFEDVRALSASILNHLLASGANAHSQLFSKHLLAAMETLIPELEAEAAQTNRSDQADGLGRCYSLCASTQQCAFGIGLPAKARSVDLGLLDRLDQLLTARPIFDKPDSQPLHSLLLGVMYYLEDGNSGLEAQDRVISISRQIWRAVVDRLCVDSPETETTNEENDLEEVGIGPKDMLSYSWRALRDSSLVLRALLNARSLGPDKYLLTLKDIGNLCMEQLTKLRHRGAFSTVSQTFMICCQRTMDVQGPELVGLRFRWYEEAKAQVDQQANRLTRRSAGLPAMLASILSPDDERLFHLFVDSFIAKSWITVIDQTERLSLPQVHAMNTLREVMINSRFRNAILPHFASLLTLATKNLGSNIWAIRNCGLMLYRSCILRLPREDECEPPFSEARNTESAFIPVKLAIDLLRNGTMRSGSSTWIVSAVTEDVHDDVLVEVEQKFAALDMLAYIHPAKGLKHHVYDHVVELLSSPVWLIRERAAEVLAFLTPVEEFRENFNEWMDVSKLEATQNKLHGILLFCRQLLKRRLTNTSNLEMASTLDEVMQKMLRIIARIDQRRLAPPVWTALFEIANEVSEQLLRMESRDIPPVLNHDDLLQKAEIRGYYLPESALTYNFALKLIRSDRLRPKKNGDFHKIIGRMVSEPNVAKFILERLLRQSVVFRPHDLLRLCGLLSAESHPDAIPFLIDMVSLSVERYLSDWDNGMARQILSFLDECSAWSPSRKIEASSLVTRARLVSLLRLKPARIADYDFMMFGHQNRLERIVSYAARDETDTYVRLQAAKALSAYLPVLPGAGIAGSGLLFTLRSLLNDDDEDVRSLSAHAASMFLARVNSSPQLGVLADGACAFAVSAQLDDHLRSTVCKCRLEPEVLCHRFLDVSPEISLESYLMASPVKLQLSVIKTESRALFAVERQNLYIDEVQEVHFWSSVWGVMAKQSPQLPANVKIAMASWVVDGLDAISAMLGEIEEVSPMLPNMTHDLDMLLLILRVVGVAKVYVALLANDAQDRDSTCQKISQQLQDLTVLSSRCHLTPELTHAIDETWKR